MTIIQTNAEINSGKSSGGMFCEHGQLIGIIVAKTVGEDVEGVGFAILSNVVRDIVNNLI